MKYLFLKENFFTIGSFKKKLVGHNTRLFFCVFNEFYEEELLLSFLGIVPNESVA